MATAGPHLRDIITDERRLTRRELADRLQGMRLLVLATVTADGRPLAGPVDGYFLHGTFWFSSARDSVRMRHLAVRPACQRDPPARRGARRDRAREGRAASRLDDPAYGEFRQAMLDEYLPKQGPSFEEWLDNADAVGARIAPEKMFTFHLGE